MLDKSELLASAGGSDCEAWRGAMAVAERLVKTGAEPDTELTSTVFKDDAFDQAATPTVWLAWADDLAEKIGRHTQEGTEESAEQWFDLQDEARRVWKGMPDSVRNGLD